MFELVFIAFFFFSAGVIFRICQEDHERKERLKREIAVIVTAAKQEMNKAVDEWGAK